MKYLGNNNFIFRLHNLAYYDEYFIYDQKIFNQTNRYTLTGNQLWDNWQKTKMSWSEVSSAEEEVIP